MARSVLGCANIRASCAEAAVVARRRDLAGLDLVWLLSRF